MNIFIRRDLFIRTFILVFFIIPIGYISGILGVAVHEILGHGLSAVLLGGNFSGFVLKWDAMGWAYSSLPSTASITHHILHLASGIIATTIFGGILLYPIYVFRKRADIQLPLLIVSFICLMDGIPYLLWNSYHPMPPGDIGRIVVLLSGQQNFEISLMRWTLFALGVVMFVGTTFYFCTSIFMRIEELILNGRQFIGRSRFLALLFFLVLPGVIEWFIFDWNQLASGIGILPNIVGALSIVAMATILFRYKPKSKYTNSVYAITWQHITISWSCLIFTIIALSLWFKDGINWS